MEAEDVEWTLRDSRLWRLSFGTGLYLVAQVQSPGSSCSSSWTTDPSPRPQPPPFSAAIQVLAIGTRIGAGRWSDRLGSRIVPLRRIGLAIFGTLAACAFVVPAPVALLVPVFVVAGGLSMAWNGLSLTAAAELAGEARSGAAIGFQQTALSLIGVAVPVLFAAFGRGDLVARGLCLAAIFPLAGLASGRGPGRGRATVGEPAP